MDKLLWYHLGKKRGGGGGGTSVTTRDLLAKTKVDGFGPNSEIPVAYARNCYFGEEGFKPFEISVGENYTVAWDNVVYKVTAKDASAFLPGVILLGNDFGTELGSNNEPFAIGWFGAGFTLFALDTLESHTIHIYQTVLDNAEVRTVGLDATQGSQIIKPTEDGKSMSEAIITMPDTLIPENIAEGVDIGGVKGAMKAGGGFSAKQVAEGSIADLESDGITMVGDFVFYKNTSLQNVVAPNLTIIGQSAFEGCDNLKSVTVSNVQSIGSRAFYGCKAIKTLDFGTSINSVIGASAFNTSSTTLNVIIRNTTMIPDASSPAVGYLFGSKGQRLFVPRALVSTWKSSNYMSQWHSEYVYAIEDYPDICG